MKALVKILLYSCGWLLISSPLSAFTEIANGPLTLSSSLSISSDSNINGNSQQDSDTFMTLVPTLQWQRPGPYQLSASFSYAMEKHDKFNALDSNNLSASFSANLPTAERSPLSGSFSASYVESSQIDQFLFQRVNQKNLSATINSAYRFRPSISAYGSVSYNDSNRDLVSGTQSQSYAAGFSFHNVWREIGFDVGYRYRQSESDGTLSTAAQNNENSLEFGLSGQLLPKDLFPALDASLTFSYQNNNSLSDQDEDINIIGINGSLAWEPRPTTKVTLSISRNLDLTPSDKTVEAINYALSINQQLAEQWSTGLTIGYNDQSYLASHETRDIINSSLFIGYNMNERTKLRLNYSYTKSYADNPDGDYDRNLINLTANYRF